MAVFAWRGITNAGKEAKGVRDADNPRALRMLLKREGIRVTQILEEAEARKERAREVDLGRYLRRITTMDVAVATRQMATLLKSGVPLVQSLSALIDQVENPEFKTALTQVRDRVNEGTSLADSLKEHGNIFPPLYVNMVAAGEASGTLETVLQRLAVFQENQSKLQGKVIAALAYPVIMFFVGLLAVAVMMIFVIPKVTAIFEDFEQALPWYTQLLIWTSDMFADYWWLLLIVIVGGTIGFTRWKNSVEGRRKWDKFVLTVPVFGKLLLMLAMARFSRTLATLLAGGVPLLRAMEITRNVLGNVDLEETIAQASDSIREGESIAAPLQRSGKFPPIVTHMIAVGERSGQLEEMLENVADSYDHQVEARIQTTMSLLEPLIILGVGLFAGGIAFSILVPLMRINEFVQ